jgi:hypothetical protein
VVYGCPTGSYPHLNLDNNRKLKPKKEKKSHNFRAYTIFLRKNIQLNNNVSFFFYFSLTFLCMNLNAKIFSVNISHDYFTECIQMISVFFEN